MSKTLIIMANGEEIILGCDKEEAIKMLTDKNGQYKNKPVTIDGIIINPNNIATIKEKFMHSMMPGITGVSTKW